MSSVVLAPAAKLLSLCRAWSGILYRSASPKYAATDDILSGAGTKLLGGRWTPAGAFRATYLSLDPETAFAESLAHHRYYSIELQSALPRVVVAARADLAVVLDLTDAAVAAQLGIDLGAIVAQDWRATVAAGSIPDSHRIAITLHAARLEGFIVPSAARRGFSNLVILPDSLRTTSTISVLR